MTNAIIFTSKASLIAFFCFMHCLLKWSQLRRAIFVVYSVLVKIFCFNLYLRLLTNLSWLWQKWSESCPRYITTSERTDYVSWNNKSNFALDSSLYVDYIIFNQENVEDLYKDYVHFKIQNKNANIKALYLTKVNYETIQSEKIKSSICPHIKLKYFLLKSVIKDM